MSTTDQKIDLPSLKKVTDDTSTFTAGPLEPALLSAVMIRALEQQAAAAAGTAAARIVTVSTDIAAADYEGGEATITSRIDRQTRTLIFMGAELTSKAGLHLRATAIFRLETE